MLAFEQDDEGIVAELGRRSAAQRLARNLTQAELGDHAGVARSTVQRLEGGDSIQLTSFVKLLRALDRLDGLEAVLVPEPRSPVAELERRRRRRRRARRGAGDAVDDAEPWSWEAP